MPDHGHDTRVFSQNGQYIICKHIHPFTLFAENMIIKNVRETTSTFIDCDNTLPILTFPDLEHFTT